MHKRFRIFLAASVIILSSLAALIPTDTAKADDPIAWQDGKYSTQDGQHISSISCVRWDSVTPSGETSTNKKATLTYTFVDGFQGTVTRTAGTFIGIGWVNCQDVINEKVGQLTSGSSSQFMRCIEANGCYLNTDTDKQYSLHNKDVKLFPEDQPPANATITANPNSVNLTCPEGTTTSWTATGASDTKQVAISLSGTNDAWTVVDHSHGLIATKTNNTTMSVYAFDPICGNSGSAGAGTTTRTVTVGIPGTSVRTDIDIIISYHVKDVWNPDNPDNPPVTGGGTGTTGEASPRECDLGKFGWALCPILTGLDSMLGGIYSWVEENFLQIQVDFYRATPDNGTYQAWTIFRNVANILFVIFFLIVIFSQVTSVGISNYGIKKMLPEIIMAAILINVSYFVVQAMIDLSNIVGFQIKSLLENLVSVGPVLEGAGLLENLTSILGATAIVTGAAAGGTLIAMTLSGGLGAMLAAVFLFLLSAFIGILILFLLLVVRQVGVIILVVLAPLAFASRILPNTQNLFRTWWRMITTLLLVYPACGLVIGGGKLAGRIIIMAVESGTIGAESVGSAFSGFFASIFGAGVGGQVSHFAAVSGAAMYVVVAMIAMIAPYFAVISIIKGSLNGLGKLGGAITGKLNGVENFSKSNLNKAPGLRSLQRISDTGREARAAKLKAKTGVANAKAAADNRTLVNKLSLGTLNKNGVRRSAVDKMNESNFKASQAQDDATMASLGQYQGERNTLAGKRLGRISDANARRLNVNADGTPIAGAPKFAAGSWEEQQQMAARTAVLQQEAKTTKQIDEQFDSMLAPGDVYDSVYNTTGEAPNAAASSSRLKTTGNSASDALRYERAIQSLIKKGDIEKATRLTQAYTSSDIYKGISRNSSGTITGTNITSTKHNQQRLASILSTGDVKKEAANLYAYGWQTGSALSQGAEQAFSYADMDAGPVALMRSDGSDGWTAVLNSSGAAVNTGSIESVVRSKIDVNTVASQDKDADWSKFSATQMAGALASGASADKTKVMEAALVNNETLSRTTAAELTAKQLGKVDDTSFATMRKNALLQVAAASKKAGRALTAAERDEAINGTSSWLTTADRDAIANGTSTILTSAEKSAVLDVANGRTGATSTYMASQAAAQAVTQKAFGEAYAQTQVAGSRAADDWSAARRNAFGL